MKESAPQTLNTMDEKHPAQEIGIGQIEKPELALSPYTNIEESIRAYMNGFPLNSDIKVTYPESLETSEKARAASDKLAKYLFSEEFIASLPKGITYTPHGATTQRKMRLILSLKDARLGKYENSLIEIEGYRKPGKRGWIAVEEQHKWGLDEKRSFLDELKHIITGQGIELHDLPETYAETREAVRKIIEKMANERAGIEKSVEQV